MEFGEIRQTDYPSMAEANNKILFDNVAGKNNLGKVLQSWHEDLHLDISKKPILKVFKHLDLT